MEMRSAAKLRARAGELLSHGGNRLLLIEAQSILLLLFSVYLMLSYSFSFFAITLLDELWIRVTVDFLFGLLLAAFAICLVLPLFFGLFFMAWRMACGEACTLSYLFVAFGDRSAYVRAIWGMRFLIVVGMLLSIGASALEFLFFADAPSAFWDAVTPILCLVFACLLSAPFYLHVYEALTERERGSITPARRIRRAARFGGIFFPWLLLGLLTVGVLLIADVFPRMLIFYALDGSDACGANDDVSEDGSHPASCDK